MTDKTLEVKKLADAINAVPVYPLHTAIEAGVGDDWMVVELHLRFFPKVREQKEVVARLIKSIDSIDLADGVKMLEQEVFCECEDGEYYKLQAINHMAYLSRSNNKKAKGTEQKFCPRCSGRHLFLKNGLSVREIQSRFYKMLETKYTEDGKIIIDGLDRLDAYIKDATKLRDVVKKELESAGKHFFVNDAGEQVFIDKDYSLSAKRIIEKAEKKNGG